MHRLSFAAAGLALLGTAACTAIPDEPQQLVGGQILMELSGRTIRGSHPDGTIWMATLRPNSDLNRRAPLQVKQGRATDSGEWWVENDQFCRRYRNWMAGSTACYTLVEQGGEIFFLVDGEPTGLRLLGTAT